VLKFAALALLLRALLVRQAIPFLLAGAMALATWSATKSLRVMATASRATLPFASERPDAADGHHQTRTRFPTTDGATAALVTVSARQSGGSLCAGA
jgi:hypothetical protein